MEYGQVCACGRVFLTWQVNEALSEEAALELRPDTRASQCKVLGRRPTQTKDSRTRVTGKELVGLKKQMKVNMAVAQ